MEGVAEARDSARPSTRRSVGGSATLDGRTATRGAGSRTKQSFATTHALGRTTIASTTRLMIDATQSLSRSDTIGLRLGVLEAKERLPRALPVGSGASARLTPPRRSALGLVQVWRSPDGRNLRRGRSAVEGPIVLSSQGKHDRRSFLTDASRFVLSEPRSNHASVPHVKNRVPSPYRQGGIQSVHSVPAT